MHKVRARSPLGAALLVGATLLFSSQPAAALPPPPPNPSDQQISEAGTAKSDAQAAVAYAAAAVAELNNQIEALNAQALAAADAYEQAQGQVEIAKQNQAQTATDLVSAQEDLDFAQAAVDKLAKDVYIQGGYTVDDTFLLSADGPSDLIERLNTLALISEQHYETIQNLELAKIQQANADAAAKQAVVDTTEAEAAAKVALDEMNAKLAAANEQLAVLQANKASLDAQLATAQQNLFDLEGQQITYAEWVAQRDAEAAAAGEAAANAAAAGAAAAQSAAQGGPTTNGHWALPAGGTFTSCFCSRWGTFHYGIDIANKMYTPIYAAGDGVVMRAGFANGFGQAIYILHADGWVTVYGHMETLNVVAGQRVYAGQLIAGMGMRGQSTGPHLHFEVSKGMYGTRVDPVPWLAQRGITV